MRRCGKCGKRQKDSEFGWKNRAVGKRSSMCKACHREYSDAHYWKNKAKYVAKSERYRKKLTEEVRAMKDRPCADCGKNFPWYCMDFDHRDPSTKEANVACLLRHGRTRVLAEIAKCDVVCANCHRKRTWERAHGGMVDTPVLGAGAQA